MNSLPAGLTDVDVERARSDVLEELHERGMLSGVGEDFFDEIADALTGLALTAIGDRVVVPRDFIERVAEIPFFKNDRMQKLTSEASAMIAASAPSRVEGE